jgi:uncharacterized protein YutE (UPF0331/DUF86 family)
MVDKATLDGLLANLQQYVAELRRLAAVESCIDIANHVIASEGFRLPKDNADSFAVLAEERIVSAEWQDRLASMARFRNRLVHLYSAVRDELVHEYLQQFVGDLDAFSRAIAGHAWP